MAPAGFDNFHFLRPLRYTLADGLCCQSDASIYEEMAIIFLIFNHDFPSLSSPRACTFLDFPRFNLSIRLYFPGFPGFFLCVMNRFLLFGEILTKNCLCKKMKIMKDLCKRRRNGGRPGPQRCPGRLPDALAMCPRQSQGFALSKQKAGASSGKRAPRLFLRVILRKWRAGQSDCSPRPAPL